MPCQQDTGLGCPVALLAGFASKPVSHHAPFVDCPEGSWSSLEKSFRSPNNKFLRSKKKDGLEKTKKIKFVPNSCTLCPHELSWVEYFVTDKQFCTQIQLIILVITWVTPTLIYKYSLYLSLYLLIKNKKYFSALYVLFRNKTWDTRCLSWPNQQYHVDGGPVHDVREVCGAWATPWKTLVTKVCRQKIHTSDVQRKWLLSSDHWELLNVFSLPEIKYCTSWKVSVDILESMIGCVNSQTTVQEFTDNSTDECVSTVTQTDHSWTLVWHTWDTLHPPNPLYIMVQGP
jgi:hypothetical protein